MNKQLTLPTVTTTRILPKTSFLNTTVVKSRPKVQKAAPPAQRQLFIPNKGENAMLDRVSRNIRDANVDAAYNEFSTLHKMTNGGLPIHLLRVMIDYSLAFNDKHGSFPAFYPADLAILVAKVSPLDENPARTVKRAVKRLADLGHLTDVSVSAGSVAVNREELRRIVAARAGL